MRACACVCVSVRNREVKQKLIVAALVALLSILIYCHLLLLFFADMVYCI